MANHKISIGESPVATLSTEEELFHLDLMSNAHQVIYYEVCNEVIGTPGEIAAQIRQFKQERGDVGS